ncbi:MAG: 50S ribosomal protein L37ae [Candidatus Bathyarchaeota archaeon]|nr:50S ribosomal protein L37ae [Candidatus Termiticorpusculum sp.]
MKKVGSTRGLGARYGSTVRKRYVKVITELKKPHKCPQCGFIRVHRVSVGVWQCGKCNYTYAGGAYTPITKLGVIAKRSAKGAAEEAAKTAAPTVEAVTSEEVE